MSNRVSDFEELAAKFEEKFQGKHFPEVPEKLYKAAQHLLAMPGKRVRPVLCLMANELFSPLSEDTFHAAFAIELFHNFTLVHDDIMDKATVRRGKVTVHELFGNSTALLAGDVMLIRAYQYLSKIGKDILPRVLSIYNETAVKVCEGQEFDIEFEEKPEISLEEYIEMIGLKTSVLLAASLQIGSILGGAGLRNQENLYSFGKNMGIAFQIQDDYLDAFGDADKFGKIQGGDIMANKKTFLHLRAMGVLEGEKKQRYQALMQEEGPEKIASVIELYKECGIHEWAQSLKKKYYEAALENLEAVAVVSTRKKPLQHLATVLLDRQK